MPRDCLVLGGGVVGLSVAYACARRGASVLLLEAEASCGTGASAAAAGMLAAAAEVSRPGPFLDLCLEAAGVWRRWAPELLQLTGVDVELEESGLLRVAQDEAALAQLVARQAWQQAAGLRPSGPLSGAECRRLLPALGDGVRGGVFYAEGAHLHSHRAVDALLAGCRRLGVSVRTMARVTAVALGEEGVTVTLDSGQSVGPVPRVVVAAGAWAGPLLRAVGVEAEVKPVKGQIIAGRAPGLSLPFIVYGEHGYLLKKRSQLLLVGATEEDVGFDLELTSEAASQLAGMASGLVPELGSLRFDVAWSGLRPLVAPGMPLLGALPGHPEVLLAVGHYRNGMLLAPLTGELIARTVEEGREPAELAPFSLAAAGPEPARRWPG